MDKISFCKYLSVCAIGFGLGGALWGLVLYNGIPDVEFPFHYVAIIIMGLFGGVSLKLFSKDIKEIAKSILAGWLGFGVGFVVTAVFSHSLYLYGGFVLIIIPLKVEVIKEFLNLEPNIGIGSLWLVFLFSGAIIGLFYALFFKLKIWPLMCKAGIGFGLGSLIGPIIGNVLGSAFNSLLITYIITFVLISLFLGTFLGWEIYKSRDKEIK
ncbi:MAG: hypothetical protein V1829_00140 [bacterium]